MGASVTGIDPAERNVRIACLHAEESGVPVDYRATTAEALADEGARFDVVMAMEVVEHVADVGLFLARAARDGEAGRAARRGDAEPHQALLRARHRRGGICARLAAARHA